MSASGTITKINNDLEYGFIKVSGMDDVFFSTKSVFEETAFGDLKVGDKVRISVEETDRGPFAKTLGLFEKPSKRPADRAPEANL